MKSKKLKVLFFHGLESNGLSDSKRSIFESLGISVEAPIIDYKGNPFVLNDSIDLAKIGSYDFIVGSSIGGRLAFYVGNLLNIPYLIFNPAIISKTSDQYLPVHVSLLDYKIPNDSKIVWGSDDTVINNTDVKNYLIDRYSFNLSNSSWVKMGHRVDSDILKGSLDSFISLLK